MILKKIISGGQKGADIAALETAKEYGIKTGGFVPKDYRTEAGSDYNLSTFAVRETSTSDYDERTKKNIMTSDGTVIFSKLNKKKEVKGSGTIYTYELAVENNKPIIVNPTPLRLANWIRKNKIKVLNVAGNRASQNPRIYSITKKTLKAAIEILRN
jgi:putative molybdenum carrier protein